MAVSLRITQGPHDSGMVGRVPPGLVSVRGGGVEVRNASCLDAWLLVQYTGPSHW